MPDIHPTALVNEQATLAEDVTVGAFTIIDAGVSIGPSCHIGAHAWITGNAVIGEDNHIGHGSIVGGDPQDLSFDPQTNSNVVLGKHNRIREYVTIHRSTTDGGSTTVGDSNFLMTNVHLAHDVQMGNSNNIANNVMLAGHIQMGSDIFLGGGAGFHQFIHIGDYAIAQGNASISKDIPPFCLAHGLNNLSGLNVIGLRRGGFKPDERAEIKRAYQLLFKSSGNLKDALETASESTWGDAAQILLNAAKSPSRKGVIMG